ncbi:MAG: cyanophycinase [Bacteroidetes bacterium]|nr:cyanophycinase [Bacteroidota bacterium]HET6244262.1 cyanophycinase [Bacteroidia bacterium]
MKRSRPKGKLLAIGGNEHSSLEPLDFVQENNPEFISEEILKRMIEECRDGKNSLIGIITTSSSSPMRTAADFRDVFHELGCHRTEILDIRSKDEANKTQNLRLLEKLDAVFITGGDQVRIGDYLCNSEFNRMLVEKYMNEDFLIAGTSSGAMALADYMISRGSAMEGFYMGEVEISRGLSFIKNVIIDTHFDSRGRFGRLTQAACKQKATGVGIGDDTAILITPEQELHVIGSGIVTIIDIKEIIDSNLDSVPDGVPFRVKNLIVHILSRDDVYKIKDLFPVYKQEEVIV